MNKRHICSAKAAERDYFCFVDVDDEEFDIDPFVPDQMLRTYDSQHAGTWHVEPLDRSIASICRYTYPDRDRSIFVSLTVEGEVGFIGKQEGFYERIPGAGLQADDADGYGYMRRIRQIGGDLFACGLSGQVYRRSRPNDWRHLDAGLLLPPSSSEVRMLEDVNGSAADDLYAVGNDGLVFHFDGATWQRVKIPTDEWLHAIHVENTNKIWICGRNGTLLEGNAHDGFTDRSDVRDNDTFVSIAPFAGKLYLGRETGVSIYDGTSIQQISTGLRPELRDGHLVDAVDGVLWSFGYSDIARFDGVAWKRYPTDKP